MNSVVCNGQISEETTLATAISLLIFIIFLSSSPLFLLHLLPFYNLFILGALCFLLLPIIYTNRLKLIQSKLIITYYFLYIWIIAFNLFLGKFDKVLLVYVFHLIILLMVSYYIFTYNHVQQILKKMLVCCFFLFACGQIIMVLLLIANVVEPSIIRLDSYFGQNRLWVPFLGFVAGRDINLFGIVISTTCSFYLEPSAYAGALIFPLTWSFINCLEKKKKIVPCLCFITILVGALMSGSATLLISIIAMCCVSLLNWKRDRLLLSTTALVGVFFITFIIVVVMLKTSEGTILQMTDLVGQESLSESEILNKRSSFFARATTLQNNINKIVEKPLGPGFTSGEDEDASVDLTSNLVTAYLISGPLGLFILLLFYLKIFKNIIKLKGVISSKRQYLLMGTFFLLLNSFISSYTFYTVGTIIFLSIFIKDIEMLTKNKNIFIS